MSPKPSEPQEARAQDGLKANTGTVIRYSREFLLECAKSPLVQRPEGLPPKSVWFGIKTVSAERIVLGPPKMSFASSSFSGLKKAEDGPSGFKKTLDSSRENRSPRGPPSALEQGFGRETIEKLSSHKLPKVTPKDITGLLSGMDRRRHDPSRLNSSTLTGSRTATSSTSSRLGSATRTSGQPMSTSNTSMNSSSSNGIGLGSKIQRSDAPEWMSYNPESENLANDGENNGEPQAFVDDIQAWKARMKEHEKREKEKETSNQSQRDNKDPRVPSRADSSSSWRSNALPSQNLEDPVENKKPDDTKNHPVLDKSLGRALLSNEPIQDIDIFFSPGGIDLTKPFDTSSAFDKFLSQHAVAISTFEESGQQKPGKADGSRFARFFTEDEPEPVKQVEQPSHSAQDMPGRQLSLDQLFQAHAPNSTATAPPPPPPPLGRMPSEAEILESMRVNKSLVAAKSVDNSEESADAFGFSKIMAALSKPPLGNAEPSVFGGSTSIQPQTDQPLSGGMDPSLPLTRPPVTAQTLQDPSIVTFQSKPTLLDTLMKQADNATTPSEPSQPVSSSVTSESSQTQGSGAATATTSPSTPSSDTSRPAHRPVQVAFGGGIPTSVYRQLSGKTDGQKSASPLIRPLSSANGMNTNGGSSPSLSSPSASSPRQFNPQAAVPSQQTPSHQQQSTPQASSNMQQSSQLGMHQQQQSQQPISKNFGPYSQGSGPVLHSPAMDPRVGGMYGNSGPPPMSGHGHVMENEPPAFFNGMPMQRPTQGVPPQFGQQMPPFSQQVHVSGPNDFMPPHPSQFGMPPFGAPMHPNMFPMNPVEMLMHRGPGGPLPPPRPMPGMAGPNHFVPNNFGHPMNNMPHPAPTFTFISATTSDTTGWDSSYSLGCYPYIGDNPGTNDPISVVQFGSTIEALFFPNGTWLTTIESGADTSVDYVSPKFYAIVASTNNWNWILAEASAKAGSTGSVGPWRNMRIGTTLEARTQDPSALGSDLLLTAGAIAPSTNAYGDGYFFTFSQSGTAGSVFRVTGNKQPDQNLTATEPLVSLTLVQSVDMRGISLSSNAVPVTAAFAAVILDKGPGGTISIYTIDPRTTTFSMVQSTVSGTWSGSGLVDPTAATATKSGGLNVALIGGIAAGAVVLIVIICVLIWRARSKKAMQLGIVKQQELDAIDRNNKDKMIKLLNLENQSTSGLGYNEIEHQRSNNGSSTTLTDPAANIAPRKSSDTDNHAHQYPEHRQSSKSQRPSRHASVRSTRSVGQISLYTSASSIYLVDSPSALPPTPMVPPAYANSSFENHRHIQRHYTGTSATRTSTSSSKKGSTYKVAVPDDYDDRQPLHRRNTDEFTLNQQSSYTAGSTGSTTSFNLSSSGEGGSQVLQDQPERARQPKSSPSSSNNKTSRNKAPSSSSLPSSPTSQRYPSDAPNPLYPSSDANNNQSPSSGKQRRTKDAPSYPRSKTDPSIKTTRASPTEGISKRTDHQYGSKYKESSASSRHRQQHSHQTPITPTTPISGSTAFSPTNSAFPPSPTASPTTPKPSSSDRDSRFTEAFPMPPRVQ
ncbi:hypothetical protein BGZ80_002522, partial [Entomortierella chlamydospora]